MATVYLDSEFRCHKNGSDGFMPASDDFFDGKCKSFIEGYRFVPEDMSWTRDDGYVFNGPMISPIIDTTLLLEYQKNYEIVISELSEDYQRGVNSI